MSMRFVNRMMDTPEGRRDSIEAAGRNRLAPDRRARRDAQRDEKKL